MFLVDVSPSMGKTREIEVPATEEGGEPTYVEMTHLEYVLQFVKLKMQEMVAGHSFSMRLRLDIEQ